MSPFTGKNAHEIREMWQSRALREARYVTAFVLGCAMMNEYSAFMPLLLRVTFPDFKDVRLPALTGYATIWPSGRITCMLIDTNRRRRPVQVYDDESHMLYDFRALADRLKLKDGERQEMFDVLKKWIVRDMRVGPQGNRLAS